MAKYGNHDDIKKTFVYHECCLATSPTRKLKSSLTKPTSSHSGSMRLTGTAVTWMVWSSSVVARGTHLTELPLITWLAHTEDGPIHRTP